MNTRRFVARMLVLTAWLICTNALAEPDLRSSGLFTRADVTGPDGIFVTQVMSDPDGLVLTQHDSGGVRLAAGFDTHGTWLFDPETGEVRAIGDKWQVFLVGHDLHRLWLTPETRWSRSGKHFSDTAGRQVRFSRPRAGRPTRLELRDDEDQAIRVEFVRAGENGMFREAIVKTATGDYEYAFTRTDVIAREYRFDGPATPARIELVRLHRLHRMAHLAELPELLATSGVPLLEIHSGAVAEIAPSELAARFLRYFELVEFLDWHDRAAPVLVISDDETLASKVVQKTVVLQSSGSSHDQDFAWLETWQRRDGAWRLIAIASTRGGDS